MDLDRSSYGAYYQIAARQVYSIVSPSARDNVTEGIAADAVAELVAKIEAGETIDNPEAMLTTIARRRAIDARRRWKQRRHARIGQEAERGFDGMVAEGTFFKMFDERLARSLDDDVVENTDIAVWLVDLAESAGLDARDVEIARRTFVEGDDIEDIANDLDMAEKTVRNRITMIKQTLRDEVQS